MASSAHFLRQQRDAQVVVSLGVLRLDGQRRLIGLHRLGQLALFAEHVAQIVVGAEMIGLQPQGLAVGRHRVVEAAQVAQGVGQVVVDVGRVGHDGRGRAELLDGLLQPPKRAQRVAPVVMRVARARVELHGLLEAGDGFLELLELGPGDAQVAEERGIALPLQRPFAATRRPPADRCPAGPSAPGDTGPRRIADRPLRRGGTTLPPAASLPYRKNRGP